jgi:hypothetical protein
VREGVRRVLADRGGLNKAVAEYRIAVREGSGVQ